jgi:uncharacterized protein (DUF427 family)
MPKAIWNGQVVAETDRFEEVEGNVYFPPEALKRDFVRPSAHATVCGWKGIASYFDLVDGDQVARDAVWTYREPKPAAANIKDHVPSTARRCGSRADLRRCLEALISSAPSGGGEMQGECRTHGPLGRGERQPAIEGRCRSGDRMSER